MMKSGTVIVTPRSLSAGENPLLDHIREAGFRVLFPSPGKQPTETQLLDVIGEADGYLAGVEPIRASVLAAAGRLKVISRNGTGVDNIDLEAAGRGGIVIRRAEGANARGVAELTLSHLFSAVRHVAESAAALKREHWTREKGIELEGRTLGLVGCGKVAQIVARFALALDMKVLAYDPFPDARFDPGPGFAWSELEPMVAASDFVSLHCPPPADGRPLVDKELIARMKPGAVIINTARASLLDEAAVISALDEGRLRAVTVDAFAAEPPPDWTLVKHPKVTATPHIGSFTEESIRRATEVAVANLLEELMR